MMAQERELERDLFWDLAAKSPDQAGDKQVPEVKRLAAGK